VEAAFVASPQVFLAQAEALFCAAPLRRLQVGRVVNSSRAVALARSPWLARLTELNLGNNPGLGLAGVRALADSPFLVSLTALLWHSTPRGEGAVPCLADSPHRGGLRGLYLSGNELGDAGTVALARSPHLPRLTDLDLRDNRVGDVGVRALASGGRREHL